MQTIYGLWWEEFKTSRGIARSPEHSKQNAVANRRLTLSPVPDFEGTADRAVYAQQALYRWGQFWAAGSVGDERASSSSYFGAGVISYFPPCTGRQAPTQQVGPRSPHHFELTIFVCRRHGSLRHAATRLNGLPSRINGLNVPRLAPGLARPLFSCASRRADPLFDRQKTRQFLETMSLAREVSEN